MKHHFLVAVLIGGTQTLLAQTRIAGTITGTTNDSLPGVNVVIGEEAFGATTDARGRYRITGLRPGSVRLRVSHIGYTSIDSTITLVEGLNTIDLRLHAHAYLMHEAEVTAVRPADRTPVAHSTVTREELERTNTGVDLPLLLDLQPSVVTTTDAGTGIGYTGLRIRGTDATRINVTLNGVPFNDAESQGTFFVDLPDFASSVEDISVQRGVGTSTNGPGAFGASIDLRTRPVSEDPFGEVSAFAGSYNTQHYMTRLGTGRTRSGLSLDGRLSSITSDGYIDRATADLKSYFLQGAWTGKRTSVRFITFKGHERTYQAWAGVPREVIDTNRTYNPYTYDNEVDDYTQTHYQLLFDRQIGEHVALNITGFRVDGAGYYESYEDDASLGDFGINTQVIDGDTIATSDLVQRQWLDNTLQGVNASVIYGSGAHQAILGGSYSDYAGAHYGEVIWSRFAGDTEIRQRYYDNDADKTDANVFAKLTHAVGRKVELFGDAQLRWVDYRFLGYDNDLQSVTQDVAFTFFDPKAGVNWRVHEGGRVYASVGVADREPNRDDFTESTPQSRPTSERLVDYEAGYQRRSGRLALGVNGYYMDYTDQLVLTGELNDVGAAIRTNVSRSYRAGIELTWSARLTTWLLWQGNASYSRNRIIDLSEYVDDWDNGGQQVFTYDDTPIAFSPDLIAASELGFTLWNKEGKGRADLTLVTKYVGVQYLDNSGSAARQLDAYLVNDLRLNVSLTPLRSFPHISLILTVRNLLNEQYENNGWSYSYISDGSREELVGLYPQALLDISGGVTVGL
ncbi:MAG: TonB-dependent receptor [Flavobacteriales bacterium]|nr:TonB-dependent receptor [Flavobacteriales bacterium]